MNYILSYCLILLGLVLTKEATASLKEIVKNRHEYKKAQSAILDEVYYQPEQIHISYGVSPSQMIITWTTLSYVSESVVEYGIENLRSHTKGYSRNFQHGGSAKRNTTVHQVLLNDLIPGVTYRYHCGSPLKGWSSVFFFTTMKSGSNWSPRFAVFGDMGNENAKSMAYLQEDTMNGYYDAILHVGDFAYDMINDDGRVGDVFMNQVESIAAYVPYMTCVGNHENAYNFSEYVNRFNMPNRNGKTFGGDNNHFFSFNIGPAHIISFSTEFYYYTQYGFDQVARQYEWLEEDLMNANKPENRKNQPWIITMGHRPMYCTNADADDCTKFDDRVRNGMPDTERYGLESLFHNHGVDLTLWAHEHSYERLWPIYDHKNMNGSIEEPYRNPKSPVHITTGSAGCKEIHDPFRKSTNISAFRSDDYGYSRMQVYNSTHLHFEQISVDQAGKIIDEVWIIKTTHG